MNWFFKTEKDANPFNVKPNANLIGVDEEKEKLVSYIKGGGICFLTGHSGIGKSSLLEWLNLNFKNHTIVYLDAKEIDEFFDLKTNLIKHGSILRRILRRYPKNIVVCLDEAQDSNEKLIDSLQTHWNKNKIKSIVVTQTSPTLDNLSDSFKDRIGDKVVRLKKMTVETARKLIHLRTNGNHPFDEEAIDLIAEKANFIPRKILEKCEVVLRELKNKKTISSSDVEYAFNKIEEEEIEHAATMKIPKLEDSKIKDDAFINIDKVDKLDLSPMQKRIIKLLVEGNKTTKQLSVILNTSAGSVGKQLSEMSKAEVVGILEDRRPKVYALKEKFKETLL